LRYRCYRCQYWNGKFWTKKKQVKDGFGIEQEIFTYPPLTNVVNSFVHDNEGWVWIDFLKMFSEDALKTEEAMHETNRGILASIKEKIFSNGDDFREIFSNFLSVEKNEEFIPMEYPTDFIFALEIDRHNGKFNYCEFNRKFSTYFEYLDELYHADTPSFERLIKNPPFTCFIRFNIKNQYGFENSPKRKYEEIIESDSDNSESETEEEIGPNKKLQKE
jgi:hypothetical protein